LDVFDDHRSIHSFPTRRSSDLHPAVVAAFGSAVAPAWRQCLGCVPAQARAAAVDRGLAGLRVAVPARPGWPGVLGLLAAEAAPRSEEHTSELQSRENLVCRLLL